MNCKQCQQHLNRYLDQEINRENMTIVEKHLSGCSKCRRLFQELSGITKLLQQSPKITANPFLWPRIRTAIQLTAPEPLTILIRRIFKIWVPLAGSLIIVFSVILKGIMAAETKLADYVNKEIPAIERAIEEIPESPDNLERIAINTIIYRENLSWKSYHGEVNHVGF